MNAVDTNVVVRLIVGDDRQQTAAAQALFAENSIWIAKTVILETAWVLQSSYGLDQAAAVAAITKLLGLDGVTLEDSASVAAALALTAHGLDFADALHLASTPAKANFITFDKTLARQAKRAGVTGIATPPAAPRQPRH